jgi:hypothetical protein
MQPSDLNDDGVVDSIDLSILVSRWGTSDVGADINGDGIVDAIDLSILVSDWGEVVQPTNELIWNQEPMTNWNGTTMTGWALT